MPTIDESKCILVIGATSGIGRALALRLATLPSKPRVIAAGRRKERLQELAKAGLETIDIDVDTDNATLKKFAERIIQQYPDVCLQMSRVLHSIETLTVTELTARHCYLQRGNAV